MLSLELLTSQQILVNWIDVTVWAAKTDSIAKWTFRGDVQ